MKFDAIKINIRTFVLVGAIIFLAGVGIVYFFFYSQYGNIDTLKERADTIVNLCASAPYRPICYEKEVPKLLGTLTSNEVFDLIREIRKRDTEYLFCHVLAHKLGEYEVSLDPNNWLDVIATAPIDGLCSNGFTHGAIVSRFNDGKLPPDEFDGLVEDLSIACEKREGWNPTSLLEAMCYHGVGHVLVHTTEADVPVSLESCQKIALKDDGRDYRQVCMEGVYMQLFQPLEPEDYALIDQLPEAPTRDNITDFCNINSSNKTEYAACWREAWPLFYDELFTKDGVLGYCGALTDVADVNRCFVSAFTINGRHHLGASEKMSAFCNSLPSELQGMCFARGANAFPEEDPSMISQAIDMCSSAIEEEAQDECYDFLARTASFNFHEGSDALEEMCTSLPSEYKNTCRTGW